MKTAIKTATFLILTTLTFFSYAQDKYVCTSQSVERIVEVEYLSETEKVPCNVKYTKPEGVQVLWSADNQEGYCEEKAEIFVDKLTAWGWDCSGLMMGNGDKL